MLVLCMLFSIVPLSAFVAKSTNNGAKSTVEVIEDENETANSPGNSTFGRAKGNNKNKDMHKKHPQVSVGVFYIKTSPQKTPGQSGCFGK